MARYCPSSCSYADLCWFVVWWQIINRTIWSIQPYLPGLLHGHRGNSIIVSFSCPGLCTAGCDRLWWALSNVSLRLYDCSGSSKVTLTNNTKCMILQKCIIHGAPLCYAIVQMCANPPWQQTSLFPLRPNLDPVGSTLGQHFITNGLKTSKIMFSRDSSMFGPP